MRVLYLITRAERGGGQMHVLDLLRGYADLYDCHLATGEQGFLCEMAEGIGVSVHNVPSLVQPISPLKDLSAVIETVRLIWRLKPDLIHAHTSKAGLVARLAGAITRTPVVYTVHMWSFTEGFSCWRSRICVPIEKLCAKLSAHTITVSEANRQLAIEARIASAAELTTIRNAVPDVEWRATPGGDGVTRIVMVARFAAPKDQLLLVRALSNVTAAFELMLVGSGPELEQVRNAVEELGLNEKVKFLFDRDDIAEILSTAHIFVLASRWEGLPITILEAMRAGLPVIASAIGGIPEQIQDGENGLLAPPSDEAALAGALRKLIADPELRARMGSQGRKRYEHEFSYAAMLSKTQAIYHQVVPVAPTTEEAFA